MLIMGHDADVNEMMKIAHLVNTVLSVTIVEILTIPIMIIVTVSWNDVFTQITSEEASNISSWRESWWKYGHFQNDWILNNGLDYQLWSNLSFHRLMLLILGHPHIAVCFCLKWLTTQRIDIISEKEEFQDQFFPISWFWKLYTPEV